MYRRGVWEGTMGGAEGGQLEAPALALHRHRRANLGGGCAWTGTSRRDTQKRFSRPEANCVVLPQTVGRQDHYDAPQCTPVEPASHSQPTKCSV